MLANWRKLTNGISLGTATEDEPVKPVKPKSFDLLQLKSATLASYPPFGNLECLDLDCLFLMRVLHLSRTTSDYDPAASPNNRLPFLIDSDSMCSAVSIDNLHEYSAIYAAEPLSKTIICEFELKLRPALLSVLFTERYELARDYYFGKQSWILKHILGYVEYRKAFLIIEAARAKFRDVYEAAVDCGKRFREIESSCTGIKCASIYYEAFLDILRAVELPADHRLAILL